MALQTTGTVLALVPLSGLTSLQLPYYSARGLTQTLELIKPSGNEWLRRDVNGILRNVADTRFQKYRSTISCKDGDTPCFDNTWIGITVDVSCVIELSYPTGATPARPAVAGSTRAQGGITYYRPQMLMMIEDIRISLPEWQGLYDWQIDTQEI